MQKRNLAQSDLSPELYSKKQRIFLSSSDSISISSPPYPFSNSVFLKCINDNCSEYGTSRYDNLNNTDICYHRFICQKCVKFMTDQLNLPDKSLTDKIHTIRQLFNIPIKNYCTRS